MRAGHQIGDKVLEEQRLLATRTLPPQIVGHLLPPDERADLRQHEIGEPIRHHRAIAVFADICRESTAKSVGCRLPKSRIDRPDIDLIKR